MKIEICFLYRGFLFVGIRCTLNSEQVFCSIQLIGDRMKAERVLSRLVNNSFQIHWFINQFFGISILVQMKSCDTSRTV